MSELTPLESRRRSAKADDADDLRALKAEVAAERAAQAEEREALADQRCRIDYVLANMDAARAGAAFSPPLDAAGNSVRAQKAIRYVVEALNASPYASAPR